MYINVGDILSAIILQKEMKVLNMSKSYRNVK